MTYYVITGGDIEVGAFDKKTLYNVLKHRVCKYCNDDCINLDELLGTACGAEYSYEEYPSYPHFIRARY